jgi:glycosyltransferase involved in cell wall biosynthesis
MPEYPTISILIPIFNWDITPLFSRVMAEVEDHSLGESVEVLVVDDRSTDAVSRVANDRLLGSNRVPYLRVLNTEKNLGRCAARNLLAHAAAGEYLLFLDCDLLPDNGDFIATYLRYATEQIFDVICGGISYRTRVLQGREYDFHYSFGLRKEVLSDELRNRSPWRHLLTSNIMVRKPVYLDNPFDERFSGYGYEDIEWGIRLAQGHSILHIDNTVSHLGLVTRERAYARMRESVANYLLLRTLHPGAFNCAAVGKAAEMLQVLPDIVLTRLDSLLRRAFLGRATGGRTAFVLFQLDFAVLLGRGLKKEGQRNNVRG